MYKRIKGKKFGRTTDQRRAFMRSLSSNLIMKEKITTTKVRAKETARAVEKLITRAKSNNLASARYLASVLPHQAAQRLIREVAPRFATRQGGFTRVIKLGQRLKDGSQMAIVEFVQKAEVVAAKAKKETKKDKVKTAKAKKEKSDKDSADKKETK